MTAWRVGVAIKPETEYGKLNEDPNEPWHYVGVGMDFNFKENNSWRFQNGMGTKTPQLQFEGRFSGTWGGNLYFDYNNLYWLLFALDGYAFGTESYVTESSPDTARLIGTHIFHVSNNKSLKSFSMRFLKLDETVGGPFDEEIILLGCVMNSVTMTYEGSSTSAIKSAVNGVFVDTILNAKTLTDTVDADVISTRNTVKPVEWGCLQLINIEGTNWEKVANNEKTSFGFSRTVTTVPSCGERIDSAFYEQAVQPITIGSTVYSRDPNQWQTRMHTGGVRNDIDVTGNTAGLPTSSRPRRKGLEPIPNIRIASGSANPNGAKPDYICYAEFEDCAVDSWGNTYSSGSEITESPTLKAMGGRIIIKTPDVTSALESSAESICAVTYAFNNVDSQGGAIPNLVMQYPAGETIKLLDYKGTKDGYHLEGWTYSTQTYQAGQMVTVTTNMTFTANWVQDE